MAVPPSEHNDMNFQVAPSMAVSPSGDIDMNLQGAPNMFVPPSEHNDMNLQGAPNMLVPPSEHNDMNFQLAPSMTVSTGQNACVGPCGPCGGVNDHFIVQPSVPDAFLGLSLGYQPMPHSVHSLQANPIADPSHNMPSVDGFVPGLGQIPSQSMLSVDSDPGFGYNSSCGQSEMQSQPLPHASSAFTSQPFMQSPVLAVPCEEQFVPTFHAGMNPGYHHGGVHMPMQPLLGSTSSVGQQACAQAPLPEALYQVMNQPAVVSAGGQGSHDFQIPNQPSEIASASLFGHHTQQRFVHSQPLPCASAGFENQLCVPSPLPERLPVGQSTQGMNQPLALPTGTSVSESCVPRFLPDLHFGMASPVSFAPMAGPVSFAPVVDLPFQSQPISQPEGSSVMGIPSIGLPEPFHSESILFEAVSADASLQPLPEIAAPNQVPVASTFNALPVASLPVCAQAVGASVGAREHQIHFQVHRHFAEEPQKPDIDFAPKLIDDSALQCLPQEGIEINSISSTSASTDKAEVQSLVPAPSAPASSSKALSIVRSVDDAEIIVRPALIRTETGTVLSATVSQSSQEAQWDWQRASTAIGFKAQKTGTYLRENTDYHNKAMMEAEICINEIVYRGWGSEAKGEHTLGSSAYLLVIMLVCLTKQNATAVKVNALRLAVELVKVAIASLVDLDEVFPGMIYGTDQAYHQSTLQFGNTGIVTNLYGLMLHNSACSWAWERLMAKGFCGYKIVSAFQCPTIWDLMVFLLWAKCHPSVRKIWSYFGQFMWPKVLHVAGKLLDKLAHMKSQKALEELPLLRTRSGRRRIIPWINKLVLLRKLKKVRNYRKSAAESHDDLVPSNSQIVKAEEFLCAALYAKRLQEAYENCYHYSVHWDPSNYDVETLVSIIFSYQAGLHGVASYLPIQNMKPVLRTEVDPEILALSSANRLTRVQGYNEIRALPHSMKSISMPLEKFFFPESLHWRALLDHEVRSFENGEFVIVDQRTGKKTSQVPKDFCIHHTPLLTSISDQGGINRAGLDYLVYKLGMSIHIQFDPFHRGWNDVKDSMKKSRGDLFKCFLAFALLWNINYGPFNSKEWFYKKQSRLKDILHSPDSAHSEPFLSFIPYICRERFIEEPSTPEGREQLLNSLQSMNSTQVLGPVVKLMRWFSWWQTEKHWSGENWATKYIMLSSHSSSSVSDSCNFVKQEETSIAMPKEGLSDKQELQQLKIKWGGYGLAPLLVTPASMYQKDVLKLIVQPCWSHHSRRAEKSLSPHEVGELVMKQTLGGWVDEVYDLIVQGFLSNAVMKELYPHMATSQATKNSRLAIHLDFLTRLVAKRSMSLVAQYFRPPLRYAALLSSDPAVAKEAQQHMQKDWATILKLEEKDASGEFIAGFESLNCIKESMTRVSYILNELDTINGTSNVLPLIKTVVLSLGDTQCVENTHQAAKDILKDARHHVRSRVHKFKACIDSKVLQTRKTEHVKVSELELALQSARSLPAFVPLTHPNTHKLGKQFQNLMQYKSSTHWWPSTSAVSQFEESMCFEFLIRQDLGGVPSLSCLLGSPGTVLISKEEQLALMALAKTSCGFTAWVLEVVSSSTSTADADSEDLIFKPVAQKSGFVFRHVQSTEVWLVVPTEPLHHKGCLALKQTGEPVELLRAKLQSGLDLTVRDVKSVLAMKGVELKGAPSKAECYDALIRTVAKNEDEVKDFLSKSSLKQQAEQTEDNDEEYQELLELLEEDVENRNDPDVKNEKKRLAKKKMSKHKQQLDPEHNIILAPPKKGKGKGRGKGRGKGKGKTRGKVKQEANQASKCEKPLGKFQRGGKKRKATQALTPEKAAASEAPKPTEVSIAEIEATFDTEIEVPPKTLGQELPVAEQPAIVPSDGNDMKPVVVEEDVSPGYLPTSPASDFDIEELLATPSEKGSPPKEPLCAVPSIPEQHPPVTPSHGLDQVLADESVPAQSPNAASSSKGPAAEKCADFVPPSLETRPLENQKGDTEVSGSQVVPEDVEAPEPTPRLPGISRGPKVFSSPAALQGISPPGCSIRLNRCLAWYNNCFELHFLRRCSVVSFIVIPSAILWKVVFTDWTALTN